MAHHSNEKLIIVGDLNAAMGVFSRYDEEPLLVDARGRRLLMSCAENCLAVVNGSEEQNTGWTFLRGQSVSCLDYVICSREDLGSVYMEIHNLSELSDHKPLEVVVSVEMESTPRLDYCSELEFPGPPPPGSPVSMDGVVKGFVRENILSIGTKSTAKSKMFGRTFRPNIPNSEIVAARRRVAALLCTPGFHLSPITMDRYQKEKTALSRLRRRVKRRHQKAMLEELKGLKNTKSYWNFVRSVFNGKAEIKGSASEIALTVQKALTEDPGVPFSNRVLLEMQGALDLGPQQVHPLLDEPFTAAEIRGEIERMSSSSDGDDSISVAHLLAMDCDDIADLFLQIQLSVPPRYWSQAHVIPVPKKNPTDFRPISVLPRLRRLYTAVLAKRLYSWAEENKVLQPFQTGFRPDHRTSDNVFVLHMLIRRALLLKTPLYVVLADIQKAFDMVNHEILFGFLMSSGAWGSHMNVLRELYAHASSSVKINARFSKFFTTNRGVQQGNSISPILFTLYISQLEISDVDDPFLQLSPVPGLLLADDLTYVSLRPEGLQRKTAKLETYARDWHVILSAKKTVTMAFGVAPPPATVYDLTMNDLPMRRVTSTLCNGFYMNTDSPRWTSEEHMKRKIDRSHGTISSLMVARAKVGMPGPYDFYKLYVAKVELAFNYAVESCMDCPLRTWRKVDDIQIRAAQYSLGLPASTNRLLVLSDIGAIPLTDKLLNLTLRFLVYALNCPLNRMVHVAAVEAIWMWRVYKKGWYADLRNKLGAMVFVLVPLEGEDDSYGSDAVLSIPGRHHEEVVKRMRADLFLQLKSSRYSFLSLFPPSLVLF